VAIRKRKWTTKKGEPRESWVVDYTDQHGHRHIKTFERRKDAEDYRSSVRVDVKAGIHTAPSRSITVHRAPVSRPKRACARHGVLLGI
jgi:integrase